jgi:hypothetical protein
MRRRVRDESKTSILWTFFVRYAHAKAMNNTLQERSRRENKRKAHAGCPYLDKSTVHKSGALQIQESIPADLLSLKCIDGSRSPFT